MKKLVIVEGAFDPLTAEDIDWFGGIRLLYGRIHVALWPEGERNVTVRKEALEKVPVIWQVHIGRAKDVEPWLMQQEPEAQLTILCRSTFVFKGDKVQLDLFNED